MNTNYFLTNRKNELRDPFFEEFFNLPFENESKDFMKTDIEDKGESYEMIVDVPSVEKENIKLALDDGYLTISVKTNEKHEDKDKHGKYVCHERYFGSFERSYYIGENAKEEDITAKLDKGVLTLNIKKPSNVEKEKKFITIQ